MKNPLFSKTLQGILLLVLPQVLARLGVKLDDAGTQAIAEDVCLIVGAVWSIYGRVTATEPIKNPLATNKLPGAGLLLLSTLILPLSTGCQSLSDSQRAALMDAGKLAAKVALQLGLGELGQRVNELQPYTQRLGLIIETTFSQAEAPEAIASLLKASVTNEVPAEHRAAVLAQLRRSAENLPPDPPAPAATAANRQPATGNRQFGTRLAAALQ